MVQNHRLFIHSSKKGEKLKLSTVEGGSGSTTVAVGYSKTAKQKILLIMFLSFLTCSYIFTFSSFSLLGKINHLFLVISFINFPCFFLIFRLFPYADAFNRESGGFGPYEPFIAPLCSGSSNGILIFPISLKSFLITLLNTAESDVSELFFVAIWIVYTIHLKTVFN